MPSSNRGGGKGPKLQPHRLVEKLCPDPNQPTEPTVKLAGYVGKSSQENWVRLYASLEDLSQYLEVAEDDVVHSEEAPDTVLEHGGTYIWVKQSATLNHRVSQVSKVQAQFLGGGIADANLSATPETAATGLNAQAAHVTNASCLIVCTQKTIAGSCFIATCQPTRNVSCRVASCFVVSCGLPCRTRTFNWSACVPCEVTNLTTIRTTITGSLACGGGGGGFFGGDFGGGGLGG